MLGHLRQGKVAPVLESSGALKSEKCVFFAIILFIYLPCSSVWGFIDAPVLFLNTAPGGFNFGAGF